MSVTYSVDYYQVNIGIGDCQILLLVEHPPKPQNPVVRRAVLIDGGKDSGRVTNIRQTFVEIEVKYKVSGFLKFDSVVITHWDQDHYKGVLQLMKDELDEQAKASSSGTEPFKISWLKYEDDGKPISTLYIPYKHIPNAFNLDYSVANIFGFKDSRRGRICNLVFDMDEDVALLNKSPYQLPPTDPTTLIGRELFTGEFITAATQAKTPQELLDAYKAGTTYNGTVPGLFIVAASNRHLPLPGPGPWPDRPIPGVKTPVNRSSIICLAIMPDASITHYMAGDAGYDQEARIIEWTGLKAINTRTTTPPDIKDTIPVIKASHHGAPTSFPVNMCQSWKPSYIIFSAGTMHRHPSWDRLLYVYSYLKSWRGQHAVIRDARSVRALILTCFPYYLYDKASIFPQSFQPLTDGLNDSDEVKEYKAALKGLFDTTDPPGLDLITLFETSGITTPGDKEAWAREKLDKDILPSICFLDDSAFPSASTAKKSLPTNITSRDFDPLTQVSHVSITYEDGRLEAEVRYVGPKARATSVPIAVPVHAPPAGPSGPPAKKPKTGSGSGGGSTPSPLLSNNMVMIPVGEDSGDNFFYIMSSLVEAQDATRSAFVADHWDNFVSALTNGYITLADNLTSTSATILLHPSDEWLAWLTSALSPSKDNTDVQISVTGALTDSKVAIDHFDIAVPLPLASEAASLSFGPSYTVGEDASTAIFDPTKHFLRLDMSKSTAATISLKDLLSFGAFDDGTVDFGSDLSFTLDDKNSAIWFSPISGINYSATFRLQAVASPGDWSATTDALKKIGLWDVAPTSITVVVKRNMSKLVTAEDTHCEKAPELGLSLGFSDFNVVMFCSPTTYTFALRWPKGALDAFKQLLKVVGSSDLITSFEDALSQVSKNFDILQASVEVQRTDSGTKIAMLAVQGQATLKFGQSADEKEVVFMLSFIWPRLLFRGNLYIPDSDDESWRKLMPYYEELLEVVPTVDPANIRSSLSIFSLIPDVTISTPPQGIPTEITGVMIEVDGSSISFSGVLQAVPPKPGSIPPISFESLELATAYNWKTKALSFSITTTVNLHPSAGGDPNDSPTPSSSTDSSFLFASVDYDSGKWTLTGGLYNINFGDLLTFFDPEEQSQIKDVLGNIAIKSLSLTYEYDTDGTPSQFKMDGSLVIANLELDLLYSRNATGWQVKAALSAANECTLSDVIASVCGDDVQSLELPDFIGDIKLNVPGGGGLPDNWEDSPVYLSCSKPISAGSPMVFVLQLALGKLRFAFLQISYSTPSGGTPKRPKRILMFSFTHVFPSLEIPVVGTVDSPIDGIQFLWAQDGNATAGLTRKEISEVNTAVFSGGNSGILFKESKPKPADADIVIVAGCHFMLLMNDSGKMTAILDYKFATTKNPATEAALVKTGEGEDPPTTGQNPSGGVSKAAVHKTVGPLTLSNLGLQFKDGNLFVVIDAALALGPISLDLLGFGLGVKLTSDFFTDFDISNFSLQLHGLAAGLNQPPILLEGMFEDLSTPTMELFAGGIVVGINQYNFLAFGSYGVVNDGSDKYKTFFFFAQLHGPLVELEFATLNGITLGFGYNSHLKYPTADDILDFPLVKGISSQSAGDASSSSNALAVLSDAVFKTWVHPQNNSLWFAVGLEALAFETLDVRAVAVIEIDPYVTLGLFADAVCSLPPSEPRNLCFVYVELGITCSVDIKNGTFSVEGKLSPNSFVLHPSCHLLGGFALYYWFYPSPYAGDFVFSVGGYHPAYRPPSYYPRPGRLAISWQLDSHIGITGEAFFAVTPKVCMGGGSLSVLFSAGPIEAHLNAHAEFLMVWNPFHFIGDIGVSIGVGFHAKILFINIHISVDVGGTLHLEGPPFGGNVHVNFYLFGFDIYFGSHPGPPPPLSLGEFWNLLARSSNQQGGESDTGLTLVVQSGYAPGQNKEVTPAPGTPWLVLGGKFKFLVQCRFALKTVQYKDGDNWHTVLSGTTPVYSKPMHSTEEIESTLTLVITKHDTQEDETRFTFQPIPKNVPSAQWGQYISGEDPGSGSTPDAMLDGSNATLNNMLMGVVVTAPTPEYPDDHIPPFEAHDAMFVDIAPNETFPPGDPSKEADSWVPKETTWDGAQEAWSSPSVQPQNVVDSLAKAFKWADKLVGSAPPVLLKNFQRVYLDCPSLTSA